MSDIFTKQRKEAAQIEQETEVQKKRDKIFMTYAMGTLGLFALFAAYIFYLLHQPGVVLEIKNSPVSVRPTEIDDEQYVILHYDYCKHSNAEGKVETALISKATKVLLPDVKDRTEKDCKVFDAPYPVPGQTPPGKYHYHFKACYQLNILKQSCTEWRSQEFTIVAEEFEKDVETTNQ